MIKDTTIAQYTAAVSVIINIRRKWCPATSSRRLRRHPPSCGTRIFLLNIKGGVYEKSNSRFRASAFACLKRRRGDGTGWATTHGRRRGLRRPSCCSLKRDVHMKQTGLRWRRKMTSRDVSGRIRARQRGDRATWWRRYQSRCDEATAYSTRCVTWPRPLAGAFLRHSVRTTAARIRRGQRWLI